MTGSLKLVILVDSIIELYILNSKYDIVMVSQYIEIML